MFFLALAVGLEVPTKGDRDVGPAGLGLGLTRHRSGKWDLNTLNTMSSNIPQTGWAFFSRCGLFGNNALAV